MSAWTQFVTTSTDDEGRLLVHGRRIPVRWVFQASNYKEAEGDNLYFIGLAYDEAGQFYGVAEFNPLGGRENGLRVEKLEGKKALRWFVNHAAWDESFARELCRAVDQPEFEFMPLVPTGPRRKAKRRARKAAEAFHQQLLMATALVACVRRLEDDPTIENLADACRSASALHLAIHAPENFKAVSAA